MRAGQLRHRVTIQEVSEISSPIGGVVEIWGDVADVWVSIEPGRSREFMAARQINAEITHEIRMRYLPDIKPKMRLKFGERIFNIDPPRNISERNNELIVMAIEEVRDAGSN
jgi:SPP1 family predicted phage head-tail adaptor